MYRAPRWKHGPCAASVDGQGSGKVARSPLFAWASPLRVGCGGWIGQGITGGRPRACAYAGPCRQGGIGRAGCIAAPGRTAACGGAKRAVRPGPAAMPGTGTGRPARGAAAIFLARAPIARPGPGLAIRLDGAPASPPRPNAGRMRRRAPASQCPSPYAPPKQAASPASRRLAPPLPRPPDACHTQAPALRAGSMPAAARRA